MTNRKQYQNARVVLQSLIQGLDPDMGVEPPKDAIVNRVELNRSMLVAVTAPDQRTTSNSVTGQASRRERE